MRIKELKPKAQKILKKTIKNTTLGHENDQVTYPHVVIPLCVGYSECPDMEEFAGLIYGLEQLGHKDYSIYLVSSTPGLISQWKQENAMVAKLSSTQPADVEEFRQGADWQNANTQHESYPSADWEESKTNIFEYNSKAQKKLEIVEDQVLLIKELTNLGSLSAFTNQENIENYLNSRRDEVKYKQENNKKMQTEARDGKQSSLREINRDFQALGDAAKLEVIFKLAQKDLVQALEQNTLDFLKRHPDKNHDEVLDHLKREATDCLALMRPLGSDTSDKPNSLVLYKKQLTMYAYKVKRYAWLMGYDSDTLKHVKIDFANEAKDVDVKTFNNDAGSALQPEVASTAVNHSIPVNIPANKPRRSTYSSNHSSPNGSPTQNETLTDLVMAFGVRLTENNPTVATTVMFNMLRMLANDPSANPLSDQMGSSSGRVRLMGSDGAPSPSRSPAPSVASQGLFSSAANQNRVAANDASTALGDNQASPRMGQY